MGSYGRNFEFRVVPETENRLGRYATPSTGTWVIGSAVESDLVAGADTLGRQIIKQSSAATPPKKGKHGILVYEYAEGQAVYAGRDPYLTTYSDFSTAPVSKAVQLVSGPNVKVIFHNTTASTFLQSTVYAARTMTAAGPASATPATIVGAYLEPVTSPSDSAGYWQVTATAANAWLLITSIDAARDEVEAVFLF